MAFSPDGSSMEQYSDGSRSQSQLSQESLNSEYSQFADLGKLKPDGWEHAEVALEMVEDSERWPCS